MEIQTTIEYKGSPIPKSLKRGAKESVPLSPLIFNVIMHPLLKELESLKGFKINEPVSILELIFTDDLVLLANSYIDAQPLLSCTDTYLATFGMKIAVNKCASFAIIPTRGSWCMTDLNFRMADGS
jgi:hypothetical protein